jgi:mono/diheme cytochrome c family protein
VSHIVIPSRRCVAAALSAALLLVASAAEAQLTDRTEAPNTANAGIAKSLAQEIGTGVGDVMTPGSSTFLIRRDTARAIRRGRQLFQRKFRVAQGLGPRTQDGVGDLNTMGALGAGLADSCSGCHGRPRGAAGFGGDVATRPDSRDAPHLFGLGLKEQLADEITADLRAIRDRAVRDAALQHHNLIRRLVSKGISYGSIRANADGSVDTSGVRGVDPDLRVRPFFAHGGTISIREFVVAALHNEMGLEAVDPLTRAAANGARVVTPAGMVLDGALDKIESPLPADETDDHDHDGVANEIPTALVDYLEWYLLNYFKPATYRQDGSTRDGFDTFRRIGCSDCHVPDLPIRHDRRVADVETTYDADRGGFNQLFAMASLRLTQSDDGSGFPPIETASGEPFVVRNFFSDLKRHDVGPGFYERNYDGTTTTLFMTTPLWGVGSSAPYGHDGRSVNLREVILRHGGEAKRARDSFASLRDGDRDELLEFLGTLVLFPPDDTASNLDPGDPTNPSYPQAAHGSIKLGVLFNNPTEAE